MGGWVSAQLTCCVSQSETQDRSNGLKGNLLINFGKCTGGIGVCGSSLWGRRGWQTPFFMISLSLGGQMIVGANFDTLLYFITHSFLVLPYGLTPSNLPSPCRYLTKATTTCRGEELAPTSTLAVVSSSMDGTRLRANSTPAPLSKSFSYLYLEWALQAIATVVVLSAIADSQAEGWPLLPALL